MTDLVNAARTGGRPEIERLLQAVWPDAYRLAFALLGDRPSAEDAAQEACVIVYRTIASLRNPAAFRTWFYRVVVREASRLKRQRSRIEFASEPATDDVDPVASIDVWRALSTLPQHLRDVVVLRYVVILGAAAAADLWKSTHVSFGPLGVMRVSTTEEFRVKDNPTAEDLRNVARRTTFQVQFPVGLPSGTTIAQIGYGPSILLINYNLPGAWRRSNHLLPIVLVDPRALTSPRNPRALEFRIGGLAAKGSAQWRIGRELVIVLRNTATPAELANIKHAMLMQAPPVPNSNPSKH